MTQVFEQTQKERKKISVLHGSSKHHLLGAQHIQQKHSCYNIIKLK